MKSKVLAILLAALGCGVSPVHAGLNDRKAQEIAESSKPVAVKGGVSFVVTLPLDKAFEAAVNYLQKAEIGVEVANKDAGLIASPIEISGGWRQTGTRVVVSVFKESETESVLRVAVTEQKRYKALQTEPWSAPVVNKDKTPPAAAKMREALGAKVRSRPLAANS